MPDILAMESEIVELQQEVVAIEADRDRWRQRYEDLESRLRQAAIKSMASKPEAVKELVNRPEFVEKVQELLARQANATQSETPSRSPEE